MMLLRTALAAALILAAGWMHGKWTNRWGLSPAVSALAERIPALPTNLEMWTGADQEVDARTLRLAGGAAALSRVYRDDVSAPISVFLIGGLPAQVASHTPDVCYPGAGFELGRTTRVTVPVQGEPDVTAEVATAIATRGQADQQERLRIFWSWNDGEGWRAPEDARWSYTTRSALSKLYVVRMLDSTESTEIDTATDPAIPFLSKLLAQVDQHVVRDAPAARPVP